MKAVLIEWLDAESIDDWTPAPEIDHTVATVYTVGWLVAESLETVTVALNHDKKNEAHSCIMKIPKGMIVQMRVVKTSVRKQYTHPRHRKF